MPYIQVLSCFVIFYLLFSFASTRNDHRKIKAATIDFTGDSSLFITQEEVNKLLIQNHASVTNITKDALDLNKMEDVLLHNQMIKDAEVYVTIDGELKVHVAQRKPLARVTGSESFYIDDEGKKMPLSKNFTARVPLIKGNITQENQKEVFKILQKISSDEFLRESVVGISVNNNDFVLRLRANNFKVQLGSATELDLKIKKLKAFYQKALKDNSLDAYSWVNLKFSNQVVCTKK